MSLENSSPDCCSPKKEDAQTVESKCPVCATKGKPVRPVTIESLVSDQARRRIDSADGFRFCANPACDVAYFGHASSDQIVRSEVKVRIGQKETLAPRMVCYCFEHTVEEIDSEVAETGGSLVPDSIGDKCKQGLDRCEEKNPQGSCCLGNVRAIVKAAVRLRASVKEEKGL